MIPRRSQRQALDSDRIRTRLRMFRRTRLPQTMTPSAPYQQPIQRLDAAFRPYESVGSHDQVISGLNHTAYTLAVYAPQRELPHHRVRLASGW